MFRNVENLGQAALREGSRILRDFRPTKSKKRGFVERVPSLISNEQEHCLDWGQKNLLNP